MTMIGFKPKCIYPELRRGCHDPKCPERKAFYALMDGIVDPNLGRDLPVRFKGAHAIRETLNVVTPSENNGYGIIKATRKFDRLNRRARGRFVIVWDVEVDESRMARERRTWVRHTLLQNFVVRGEPKVKDMMRVKRICEKHLRATSFFISTATSSRNRESNLAHARISG